MAKTGPRHRPAIERFWEAVAKRSNGCWIYRGAPQRYGQLMKDDGKMTTAHRFSYELHHGPVPTGLFVCHKCDVKGCCNPEHLYAGTHEQNNQDRIDRKRCVGPIGRTINARKRYRHGRYLRREQRAELLAEYKAGKFTQTQLAHRYNVCQSTVSGIVLGRTDTEGRPRKKRCTDNIKRKITVEQRDEIRALYAEGSITQTKLAERFGITQAHVSKIILQEK